MLRIFIPEYALETICLNEQGLPSREQSTWFQIFKKQNQIYCSIKDDSDIFNPENPLFIFSQAYGVEIIDDTEYINSVVENPQNVLYEPSPVFLLDIDDAKARNIQKKYGVICQSIDNLDGRVFTIQGTSLEPEKDENGYSWHRLLADFSNLPCNALLIIDRNLFANDSETKANGVDSVFECLDELLPDSFSDEFHITIIIDPETLRNGMDFAKLSSRLNKMKGRLNRNYPIKLELVGINRAMGQEQYEKTHNRRIATNYLIMSADHRMAAFFNNRSITSQRVDAKTLYSEGLSNSSDTPSKFHARLLRDITGIREFWRRTSSATYQIAVNGKVREMSVDNWSNRLLNGFE